MALLPKPLKIEQVHTFKGGSHEILKFFALSYVSAVVVRAEDLGELLPGRKRVGMVMKLLKSRNKFLWVFSHCIFFCSSLLCIFSVLCSLCVASPLSKIASRNFRGMEQFAFRWTTFWWDAGEFQVYTRRWAVLAIFTLYSASNALQWIQYSIIANVVERQVYTYIFQPNVYQYGDGVKEKGAKNDRHARTSLYNQKEES